MSETMPELLDLDVKKEDMMKNRFLTFIIGNECYGVDIKYITEIIGIQQITEVPELEDYVKGIINLRGKIIPVVDIRIKFKKAFKEYNDRTCIIVIDIHETSIGLIVDTVSEVISIDEVDISPPPSDKTGFYNKYIKGIGKVCDEIKLLLDCEKLLHSDEIRALQEVKETI